MSDALCLGELLVDFVPTRTGAGLAEAEAFQKAAGGAPANVAVGLARLGVPSGFLGQVGDDGFGRFLADTLAGAGVDTSSLRHTARARTALAFVSLAADGDREFLTRGGVFSNEMIDAYIELKMEEVTRFRMTTHPVEFDMYYSL